MSDVFKTAKWLTWLFAGLWVVSVPLKDRLPHYKTIDSMLLREPVQKPTKKAPFAFTYQGQTNKVTPVANYEIWGLVVSHNDPGVWHRFDITHDRLSPDTRDFCVVWGNNVKSDDYRKINYSNGDYTCNFTWRGPVKFSPTQISNNHLITGDETIRDTIARVSIGDQIHIKGKLVNYSEERWNGRFRNSSTSRSDEGNGACEIIYVEEIDIIRSHNWLWSWLNRWSMNGLLCIVALRILAFWALPRKYLPMHH